MDDMFLNIEKKNISSIYYLDPNPKGAPTVLLLHGMGADGTSWIPQFQEFTMAGLRLLAPDIPGFGLSEFRNGRWTVKKVAVEILKMMDNLGIKAADVMGISLGGAIALSMAINFPTRVRRLVLVNTFAHLRPRNLSQTLYFLKRFFITMFKGNVFQAEIVARRVFPRQEQVLLRNLLVKNIMETDRRVYRQAMLSMGLFDMRRKLKKIRSSTLVVSGEEDTTVAMESQLELARGIPGACRIVIPDAGHAVSIDQSSMFNREIIKFINSKSIINNV